VQGLIQGGQLPASRASGGEEWLANPALPDDIVRESVPGGAAPSRPAGANGMWMHRILGLLAGVRPVGLSGMVVWPAADAWWQHLDCSPPPSPTRVPHAAGNIRRAEHFLAFLRRLLAYLQRRLDVRAVEMEGPATFLHKLSAEVAVDAKTLRQAGACQVRSPLSAAGCVLCCAQDCCWMHGGDGQGPPMHPAGSAMTA
jgi:hypothetical protein